MSIVPYNFSRLETISRATLQIQETLSRLLPAGERRLKLLRRLEQTLQQCVRGGCTLHAKGYRLEAAPTWRDRAAGEGVYAILAATQTGAKGLLVWDPVLALALIDRLLGGELTEVPEPRPLTEIEKGVLSYLVMQLCRVFHQFFGNEGTGIRVEKIVSDFKTVKAMLAGSEQMALADITVAIPEVSGQIQLVLPDQFVSEVLSPRVAAPAKTFTEAEQRERLERFGNLLFPMRASVGEARLTPQEIGSLEPGDIILVDHPHCHLIEGKVSGEIKFYPLSRGTPTLITQIRETTPRAQLEVKEVYYEA